MLARFGLRLRVFLMFALLAAGTIAATWAGLWLGFRHLEQPAAWPGFVAAGIAAAFAVAGVTAAIWYLFDEHLAKPIQRLAAQLRARAHAGAGDLGALDARYLGDLAPAVQAAAQRLGDGDSGTEAAIRAATDRLQAERAWLTGLLSDLPVAVVLVNEAERIVLYDAQAAEILAQIAPPRLGAPIADYLDAEALRAARTTPPNARGEAVVDAAPATAAGPDAGSGPRVRVRRKALSNGAGELLVLERRGGALAPAAARPLVYDFALLERGGDDGPRAERPLSEGPYLVFDTETTGLEPARDEIVQIAAVRVVNGRVVAGESIDTLVDPGRPIPAQASRVHGVTDAEVAGAPSIATAGAQLHAMARDAVLVAHNAPFDLRFLQRHEAAIGGRFDHPVLDTVLLSAVLFGTHEAHSLDALCGRLGIAIPPERRHTALGDAEATAAALCAMLAMLEARGFATLGQVLQETRRYGRLLQDLNA
jgi:DNA polymerase-3 subunit epsilon